MQAPVPAAALQLLGGAALVVGGELKRLERKVAGLLAHLAVEGRTSRTTLAGLLWPESGEGAARSNLRQTLHRLRRISPQALVSGEDALSLQPGLDVDVTRLELAAFAGQHTEVLEGAGELLGGFDYDDCPEFLDWLVLQRERLLGLHREARTRLGEACETAGDLSAALGHAERLLELDPVSEVVHRRIMRLHYLLGDRGAALRAYGRCRTVLKQELGVTPLPETLALAEQIEAQQMLSAPAALIRPELPLSVQRPPRLVGREAPWAVMERAWDEGQAILISGPPGVGKSRLARDFLASKGAFQVFDGQMGDRSVPFMSLVRALRRIRAQWPELPLADWVRAELSRLLPELHAAPAELGDVDQSAPPTSPSYDKLRFFEAQAQLMAQATRLGPAHLLIEDVQFQDDLSCEAWTYLLTHPAVAANNLRLVVTFRQGELPAERLDTLTQGIEAGQATLIELDALPANHTLALLESLNLPGHPSHDWPHDRPADRGSERGSDRGSTAALAQALHRHTGGNPLFLLETLRSLLESGQLTGPLPERLPVPGRLGALVARRLERLTPGAARVASVAAVAGTDFSLSLAAAVLEVRALELAEPWAELLAAQLLNEQGFTHDLLADAALNHLPAPIRALLHRRVALYLEAQAETQTLEPGQDTGTEPARVAHHWQAAGESALAGPWWLRAGEAALQRGAAREAASAFAQALAAATPPARQPAARQPAASQPEIQPVVHTAAQQGQLEQFVAAGVGLGRALVGSDPAAAHGHLQRALQAARDGGFLRWEIQAHAALSEWHLLRGELPESLRQIEAALERVPRDLEGQQRSETSELWRGKFWVELRSGRLAPAEAAIDQAIRLSPDHPWLANERALLLWHAGRFQQAAQLFEDLMRARPPEAGQPHAMLPWIANNMAWTYWALARNAEAAQLLRRSLDAPSAPFDRGLRLSNLSVVLTSLGHYAEALSTLHEARDLLGGYQLNMIDVLYRVGVVHYRADQYAAAQAAFGQALPIARQVGDPYRLTYTLASLAATHALQGDLSGAHPLVDEANTISRRIHFPLATVITWQALSLIAHRSGNAEQALGHIQNAAQLSQRCHIPEQIGYSKLLGAQIPGPHASADLAQALHIGQTYHLPDLTWRAAQALGQGELAQQVLHTLKKQSPPGWFA